MDYKDLDVDYLYQSVLDNFMMPPGRKIPETILIAMRTTDAFKTVYGNYVLKKYPNGKGVRDAIAAIEKYKHLENVTIETHGEQIVDFIYTKSILGFATYEYFAYGLENKTIEERLAFMKNNNIFRYYEVLNKDHDGVRKLDNKYNTYMLFKQYFKRDIIHVCKMDDPKVLREFCERHETFMIKPEDAALGRGIRLINTKDYATVEDLRADICQDTSVVCEELIVPHNEFVQVNPDCVNTVRIFTYYNGETVNIVCAWMKAGRMGAVVDNAGAGGMLAALDEITGVVTTDAADELGGEYKTHPDTGFVFKGFQIPRWDEAIKIVEAMAKCLPGVPMIGWDLALSENKGWQVIEGNKSGQVNVIQIPHKKGMLDVLTRRFEWEKHKKAAEKVEQRNN